LKFVSPREEKLENLILKKKKIISKNQENSKKNYAKIKKILKNKKLKIRI